jgi:hypothetical protein
VAFEQRLYDVNPTVIELLDELELEKDEDAPMTLAVASPSVNILFPCYWIPAHYVSPDLCFWCRLILHGIRLWYQQFSRKEEKQKQPKLPRFWSF